MQLREPLFCLYFAEMSFATLPSCAYSSVLRAPCERCISESDSHLQLRFRHSYLTCCALPCSPLLFGLKVVVHRRVDMSSWLLMTSLRAWPREWAPKCFFERESADGSTLSFDNLARHFLAAWLQASGRIRTDRATFWLLRLQR